MKVRVWVAVAATAASALLAPPPARADLPPAAVALMRAEGEKIFKARCATCHDVPGGKAPSRALLGQRSVEEIGKALVVGPMAPQARGLSLQDIGAVAMFVSRKAARPDPDPTVNMCQSAPKLDLAAVQWNGWGREVGNTRYQPATGISAANVDKLHLQWAFSYPGDMIYGQPTVVGDRVFVTSVTGRVQALDARTGCTIWTFESGAGTRTAVTVAKAPKGSGAAVLAYFGGEDAVVHAVDAGTGHEVWHVKVDPHASARITGSPVLFKDRLYVPVASSEEAGATPPYQCCTFRGSVVALDAGTGRQVWKTYTIADAPKPYGKTKDGTTLLGPAGASVWSAPTIDAKRGVLYVGTGNSYTGVEIRTSDAILALALGDGKVVWSTEVTKDDNFLVGCYAQKPPVCSFGICNGPGEGECPQKVGPDHDFGASPILNVLPGGKRVLVAGAKSGIVYGLDPDAGGRVLWSTRVGVGGPAGGVEWGLAADGKAVFAPSSDLYVAPPAQAGRLTAVEIATGKQLWQVTAHPTCAWGADNCWDSRSQATTASPGLVFSGSVDGHLRAYRSDTGAVVWDFDAGRSFKTVNQGEQSGGSLNLGGPTLAGEMLFVNAGYGRFAGQNGHVLLAFGLAP
jgi:polyvinyl alcohol dehydrogenase (cytochrome)